MYFIFIPFQTYIPIVLTFLKTHTKDEESELILANAWDTMLKVNFLLFLHNVESKNAEKGRNETLKKDIHEFLTFIERLFVWSNEEVKVLKSFLGKFWFAQCTELVEYHLSGNCKLLTFNSLVFYT